MRMIDADAFDFMLKDAQAECKRNGGNFRYGVLSTVRANLAKMPTVGGWISVKDRLPEDEGEYLVFEKDGYMDVSDYFEGEFSVLAEVTHWMPLPEPPKEENEW